MSSSHFPIKLLSQPGTGRDGTRLANKAYRDTLWCRMDGGRPQKIGGIHAIGEYNGTPDYSYGGFSPLHIYSYDQQHRVTVGFPDQLLTMLINDNGTVASQADRTPGALSANAQRGWQFETFYNTADGNMRLVAHEAGNNVDITDTNTGTIWHGPANASGVLTATGLTAVSGGIVRIGNYLVTLSHEGRVGWSAANDLATEDGSANPGGTKFVAGRRVRGAGAPTGILWSLDSLVRMTRGASSWAWDEIGRCSIHSSYSIVEYDNIFYWVGKDRIYMYNGIIQEVPNQLNFDWFFEDVLTNDDFFDEVYTTRRSQRVMAFTNPKHGEIWWCTRSRALIYNVRERTWYDTILPRPSAHEWAIANAFVAGAYSEIYGKPLIVRSGNQVTEDPILAEMETGTDLDDSDIATAVSEPLDSYFETHEFQLFDAPKPATGKTMQVARIEPDFVQTGEMSVTIKTRSNARATVVESSPLTFDDTASDGDEETVPVSATGRLMSFKFRSNTIGGTYEAGDTYFHMQPVDGRMTT